MSKVSILDYIYTIGERIVEGNFQVSCSPTRLQLLVEFWFVGWSLLVHSDNYRRFLRQQWVGGVLMQISTSRQPTTLWWPTRMWRVVDMGRQTFMCPLQHFLTYKCQSLKYLKTNGIELSGRSPAKIIETTCDKIRV